MKDTILARFNGDWASFYRVYVKNLKRKGKEWIGTCPWHTDKDPSFAVDNEKGLYNCFSCNKGGDAFHFYAKEKGLNTRADFQQVLKGICHDFNLDGQSSRSKGKKLSSKKQSSPDAILEVYPYCGADGELIFEVCRFEPKDFRQRRPRKDGKGYVWDMKGIQRVLYNLPAVLKAQEIWLCEGEKDANKVIALGFTATTNAGGANKWEDSYTETLRGKDVFIFPHNDPAGKDHARNVAKKLQGLANSVKVIHLPGLKAKEDISDYINAIGDPDKAAESLSRLVEEAESWHPIQDNPLCVQCVDDLLLEDLPDNWLVEKLISAEECGFIAGGPKWGKSILAQNLSMCMAAGYTFINTFPVVRPLRVLYLNTEISKKNFQRRFQLMKDNAPFAYPRENLIHITHKGLKLDNRENFHRLEEQIAYHRPEVVIIDCLYMVVTMSLDKHDTTAPFLDNISRLIETYGCTVIIIHHYRKPSQERAQTRGAGEMIGSFALHGYGDFYITFKHNTSNRSQLVLDFEMRNCQEPDSIKLVRNDETLWYEFAGVGEEVKPGPPKKMSEWDIVDIAREHSNEEGRIEYAVLKSLVETKMEVSEATARRTLNAARGKDYLKEVNPGGRPLILEVVGS